MYQGIDHNEILLFLLFSLPLALCNFQAMRLINFDTYLKGSFSKDFQVFL